MADATIGVLESTDAAAKKVDNTSLTVGADTVNRQRVNIAGAAATDLATVVAGRLSVDGSGVTQPVSAVSLPLPTGAAAEHVTAASPHAARLTDGAAFYDATKTGQLPAALVGGRLDVNIGASAVTQPVSGTVTADTELPAAAALADAAANPTTPMVGGANLVFNGVTWDRARGDITNGLDVDVTRLPALPTGTNNIGDVDVLTLPALPAGTNNIGDVDIVSGPTGASALQAQGAAAHDAAVAGNPVLMGLRANANEPAAVSADGDAVSAWADLLGRQVVVTGHPNPEAPVTVNATASGATTVIAAPGASISIYVLKASVHNRDTTNRLVDLRDGAAGTVRWRAEIAAEGGGALIDFGERGWKLTANTLLAVNLDAVGNVDVNVTAYYLAV